MNIASTLIDKPLILGAGDADRRLRTGLVRAALHDIYATNDDAGAAIGFGLMLARRAAECRPIMVIRDDRCVHGFGRLHGDGVAELGVDPAKLVVVHTPDMLATLRTAADAAMCSDLGAVVIQAWRAGPAYDLTASRRIALRARNSGVFTLALRVGIAPEPSAATTRWRVGSARSTALAANAPGHPAFIISLLHHRMGISGFDARVEWNRDQHSFRDAPLPCRVPAVATGRVRDQGWLRAA